VAIKILQVPDLAKDKYISPIRLLQHLGLDNIQEHVQSGRAKKAVLAALQLNSTGFIIVDNFEYNRTDLLDELDAPNAAQVFTYHQQIFDTPALLDFLENDVVDLDIINLVLTNACKDEGMRAFMSPYLAGSIQRVSKHLLTEQQHELQFKFLKCKDFILPEHKEQALTPVRIFITETERLFKNLNNSNTGLYREQVLPYAKTDWHFVFNAVHAEYNDKINEVVNSMINYTVDVQVSRPKFCRFLSTQMYKLYGLDAHLQKIVNSNHSIFIGQGAGTSRESNDSNYNWIWTLLWLIIMVIRFASACN
jgi:hypothetical protein